MGKAEGRRQKAEGLCQKPSGEIPVQPGQIPCERGSHSSFYLLRYRPAGDFSQTQSCLLPSSAVSRPPKLPSQWNVIPGETVGDPGRTLRVHARVGRGNGGGKPAVILVPGLVVTSRNVGPTAEHLQDRFSVYCLDLPGFGPSDNPTRVADVPGLAGALFAWMDAAGLPDAHLLGNSFGCQVVAEAAVQQPGRVKSLVLTGPALDPAIRNRWSPVWRLAVDAWREPLLVPPTLYDFWETGVPRVWGVYRSCLKDRLEDKLGRIQQPVLLVRGGRDVIARAGWLRRMAESLPHGARIRTLPKAPHAIVYSAPKQTARLAAEFIAERQ